MTEKELVAQRNSDFIFAFSGERGERVYAYLERFCLKKGSTFVAGQPDQSDFNEGARSVILEIDYLLELDLTTLEGTGEVDNVEPEKESL